MKDIELIQTPLFFTLFESILEKFTLRLQVSILYRAGTAEAQSIARKNSIVLSMRVCKLPSLYTTRSTRA